MFLTPEQIAQSTAWLSEHASPPVRYLTHKFLLNTDPLSPAMHDLWSEVACGRDAQELFSCQNEDGTWFSGGPWGPRGYRRETGRGYTLTRPKFVTTAWLLPFLGEMGFTAADERVRKSCELLLEETGSAAHSPQASQAAPPNCCGLSAIPLRALASVGLAGDERLHSQWDWLTRCQRGDGGWLNPNHLAGSPTPSTTSGRWPWDRSCAWGSFFAVEALYYAADSQLSPALTASLEFMRWHLCQQNPEHIQTWVYHGHNIVKELLMFSEAGLDMRNPPITTLLAWLKGYYRPAEGIFRTQAGPIPDFLRQINAIIKDIEDRQGSEYWSAISKTSAPLLRYHLYHLIEDDWLTYYLTRIAVKLNVLI
jgi:hypothetical protein